ncbi:MAG TPA: LLM class flavin-dependent oxidoreductase, partial [Chloroflexota bacterium]|nr:LLM class flavin-dependent oxidoreductase [Chloroflexota bacterium]
QLRDAVSFPKPLQQPRPPIWVCGSGEQLMLKVVARHGDGWNPTGQLDPVDYARRAEILARNCEAIQRDPDEIARSLAVMVVVAETETRANALVERLQAPLLSRLVPGKNVIVGNPEHCARYLGDFLRLGVTDVNVRVPPGPIGPQLAENFITLVGPRLREMAAG